MNYVAGNETIAMLMAMFIFTMIGIRYKWPFESYVMVYSPLLLGTFGPYIAPGIEPLMLMGLGLMIGFGLLALIRR